MNIPTKITFGRIIAIVGMILFLAGFEIACLADPIFAANLPDRVGNTTINPIYLGVCVVFILAALTDMIDGKLARKWNQVTDLGKFLDPVADKLLVNSMLIFLCIDSANRPYLGGDQYAIPIYLVIIMVARDIVVDCLRFVAAKKNVVIAANIFGKAKTVCQMVTIPLILLNGWPFSYFDLGWSKYLRIVAFFTYVTTAVSLISGIIYVVQNRKVFIDEKQK